MTVPEPGVRIEATRFTVTPPIDVVDLHNVQVHVEQQRDGSWIATYQGRWFDAAGRSQPAGSDFYERVALDFPAAIQAAAIVARRITERWNGRG